MKYAKWLPISFTFIFMVGCVTTQIPTAAPTPKQASYDGSTQNSGIIGVVDGGYIVTPNFLKKYDELVSKYGSRFTPAIQTRDGVIGQNIDKEHMIKYLVMMQWQRSGLYR